MTEPDGNEPRGSHEEDAPLLSSTDSLASLPPAQSARKEKKKKPWIVLVILVFLLVAIVDVGAFLAEPPKTRVFEANICLQYYKEHDPSKITEGGTVPEELCKEDVIQQRLAMIFGWQDLFDAAPGILLAVPFGTLADKVGRKWVFVASLMGLQLSSAWVLLICYFRTLPLQLTWFSAAFYLIGGGPIVASAIGITMVADIVPPDKRTSVFLYITAGVLIAELIAPILAAKLMDSGDWLPLLLALAIQQVGIFIGVGFPETLHLRDLPEPRDNDEESDIELQPEKARSAFAIKTQLRHFKDVFVFLKRDRQLTLVIFTFLANRLGRQALNLLIRYASKRYHWKIQKAAYLVSFRAATNLLALTVFIPIANYFLLKFMRLPAHWADLFIARGSIVLTTVSFVVIGIAAHPALLIIGLLVFNMGTGYNAAMRSVAIHVLGGQASPDVGRLFAVIAIAESLGVMVAGPFLAEFFEWGIELGEPWIGIPFIASAAVFAAIGVVTFMVSIKGKGQTLAYTEVASEDFEASAGSPHRDHVD